MHAVCCKGGTASRGTVRCDKNEIRAVEADFHATISADKNDDSSNIECAYCSSHDKADDCRTRHVMAASLTRYRMMTCMMMRGSCCCCCWCQCCYGSIVRVYSFGNTTYPLQMSLRRSSDLNYENVWLSKSIPYPGQFNAPNEIYPCKTMYLSLSLSLSSFFFIDELMWFSFGIFFLPTTSALRTLYSWVRVSRWRKSV